MTTDELLFASGDPQVTLRTRREDARGAVDKWEPDQLPATAEADIVGYLMKQYSIECPVLYRE